MESNTLHINNSISGEHLWIDHKPENTDSVNIKNEEKIKSLFEKGVVPFDKKFELKTEASILKLAYANNKLLSLSNSRTQILAHQVETAHRIINSLNHRFLIADEVGLGKTIEAGLVTKELIFRHNYKRILIACPASLTIQWQNEFESKFNESFEIIDRKKLNKIRRSIKGENRNPWETQNKIICSLDFIKSKSNLDGLKDARWDLVIFDEAHRLRRDYFKSTLAYNAAEIISKRTGSLLLLTATPFRGKLEELFFLVKLVDRNLLGPFQTFYNTYCMNNHNFAELREKISSVIIRKTKTEVGGFTKRYARTIRFELFHEERVLYDSTTRYIIEEFNRAMQDNNRAIGFVMSVFQKLLDSSTFALLSALKKRRIHLSGLVKGPSEKLLKNKLIEKKLGIMFNDFIDDNEEFEDLYNQTLLKTMDEIKEEIKVLDNLINIGDSIEKNKKGEKLKEIITKLKKNKIKKIIIFTQFRATQNYLENILKEYRVELFHGSLDREQKEKTILDFKEKSEILISTEAGGEGRNLQFCNVLINYDLPWSPLKIEQRIGRIHRFGQKKDVFIYNFATKGTVAERVLQVLTNKLKLFEESIGTPDILLGQVEDELNLNAIFMEMAARKKSMKKINSEIEHRLQAAKESYEKLSDLTITKKMDFNYDEYYRVTLEDRQYSNVRIENFVNNLRKHDESVDALLGRKNRISRLYKIKALPNEKKRNKKSGTFNSKRALKNEDLELLAFGNPTINHLVNRCSDDNFGGLTGVKIFKNSKKISGMVFNFIVTLKAGEVHQELFPIFIASNSSIKEYEINEIEEQCLEELSGINYKPEKYASQISRIRNGYYKYFNSAKERILKKIDAKILELQMDLDTSVTSEIVKIKNSYDKNIKEHEEQLSRQVCQMKWFKKNMKSAITRSKNKLALLGKEREELLSQYNEITEIKYSVELLNAGVLIAAV